MSYINDLEERVDFLQEKLSTLESVIQFKFEETTKYNTTIIVLYIYFNIIRDNYTEKIGHIIGNAIKTKINTNIVRDGWLVAFPSKNGLKKVIEESFFGDTEEVKNFMLLKNGLLKDKNGLCKAT